MLKDRKDAGQQLAKIIDEKLNLKEDRWSLFALPRGGVPVAHEISSYLNIPFEVLVVRKIGHPLHQEYGIGALVEKAFYWIDPDAKGLDTIQTDRLESIIENEKFEAERRISEYRQNQPHSVVKNKNILLVDDGLATGVTAFVAIQYLKQQGANKVILAVPVCAKEVSEKIGQHAEVICLRASDNFTAVSPFYENFDEVTDDEVKRFLKYQLEQQTPTTLIEKNACRLLNKQDLTPLVEKISQSKIVMLGEASHGTQEFYRWRRLISEELIKNHGFSFIAVEGDWPPSAHLNKYIKSDEPAKSARETLRSFQRWPTWMWANTEIVQLADWLKSFNFGKNKNQKASFYGLDVYSLFESVDEVITQIDEVDPKLSAKMRAYYDCFTPFNRNEKAYARSLRLIPEGCEDQVLNALKELLQLRLENSNEKENAFFNAQQNARIIKNAENYYRTMMFSEGNSWNVRDEHMMETLNILLNRHGSQSKAIVWAHNTHIGDYRATNMVKQGDINIGGLAREQWGEENVSLVGFGTYEGEVMAARTWDGKAEVMKVPPAPPETYEAYFHEAALKLKQSSYFIWLKDHLRNSLLKEVHGHRAIGVVYDPEYEKYGNYVPTSLSRRYDAFVFVDKTKSVMALPQRIAFNEIPETWPNGF